MYQRKFLRAKLVVGRRASWYESKLKDLVVRLGLESYVQFIPWVPMEKVFTYMSITDIGLIPHNSNPHTETTVPHKLFQYMLFGKPVIVSSCRPLKRIVEETGAGLVFHTGDPWDLARKISILHRSGKLRSEMGMQGRKAVTIGKYSWDRSAEALKNAYRAASKKVWKHLPRF